MIVIYLYRIMTPEKNTDLHASVKNVNHVIRYKNTSTYLYIRNIYGFLPLNL